MTTIVLSGVSGVGKTTVMAELARRLGWPTLEGDELHPRENVTRMAAGLPLSDADRRPWLAAIARRIGERERAGESSIVTSSALKRAYRDVLRDGHPSVRFVQLAAPSRLLADRMARRIGHYMPVSLLASQEADLEPLDADESGIVVDAAKSPAAVADEILRRLGIQPAGTTAGVGKPSRR